MKQLTRTHGILLIFMVTLFWGAGFILTKLCLENGLPAGLLNALRGAVLMVLTFAVFPKRILKMNRKDVRIGLIAGVTNALAYLTQALGLNYTTPSVSSFLTIMNIVFVPLIAFFVFKKKPPVSVYPAVLAALVGAYFISDMRFTAFRFDIGTLFSILCAVLFAASIAYIGNRGRETKPEIIGFWMGATQCAVSLIYFGIFEGAAVSAVAWDKVILPVLGLGFFCTFVTTNAQVLAQRVTEETTASVIMSMEAVFATAISLLVGYDVFGWRLAVGGALIMLGVLLIVLDFPSILQKRRNPKPPEAEMQTEESRGADPPA